MIRHLQGVLLAILTSFLLGCATGPQANPKDPLEPLNRSVYQFNDAVDRAVLKPVASTYKGVVPSPIRTGVSNFFNNLEDLWSFVNNSLQFKGEHAGHSIVRFGVNTVFGLGGVLDVASEMRIDRHSQDFGQTLGHWGVGTGPYLVLPLLGPSTLRDTASMAADHYGSPQNQIEHVPTRNSTMALELLDKRAQYLDATDMLDKVPLDPYVFVRNAYLQRRGGSLAESMPVDEENYDDTPPPPVKP